MIISDEYESIDDETGLVHYGTPRHSGRYPWGSGEHPYQSLGYFAQNVRKMKASGMSEAEIAKSMGMTTRQMRARYSNSVNEQKAATIAEAVRLKNKGYSNTAIGQRMGVGESTVRSWLKTSTEENVKKTSNTADILKKAVNDTTYVDIGPGVENHLGVTRTRLLNAAQQLKDEGYNVYNLKVMQVGTGKKTTVMVLAPKDATFADVSKHRNDIRMPNARSEDSGDSFNITEPPVSVSSKRVKVQYGDEKGPDGAYGVERDGVILLRPGVNDISLGAANYAQVRIAVDGTHYLKGMAMYGDPSMFPKGTDIIFNTNKHKGTPMLGEKDNSVLKPMHKDDRTGEIDKKNPFGAEIKDTDSLVLTQRYYKGKDGKQHQSAINVVNEQGDWTKWKKTIASQMLSKQTPQVAKKQLDIFYKSKRSELDEIESLTNPVVKKKLLKEYADSCDSDAVHLKGAAFPRQTSSVILPFPDMKDTEIYAPNYKNGEEVALIRYPHGGIFEIPTLRVNNSKTSSAYKTLGSARDAVGINSKVAERLSGADFDGDTVLVIPTRGTGIRTAKALDALKTFDPKEAYPGYSGMPEMTERQKQSEMGKVSNLITDMTLQGAKPEELVRAVRHSMVVIDAKKHNLNYKQSEIDNDIPALKSKYQGGSKNGAATIISRAKSQQRVHTRNEISPDPKTGERRYIYTNETYVKKDKDGSTKYDKNGNPKLAYRTITSTKMYETKDARNLMSGPNHEGVPMERVYAEHANKLKALGNEARKEMVATKDYKYSPSAAKVYSKEVASLQAKKNLAVSNAPYERRAQILANYIIRDRLAANPEIKDDKDKLKKVKSQALTTARNRVGAKKETVKFTEKEWEAVQAGAISKTSLKTLIDNADSDQLKQLSLPRTDKVLSPALIARARNLEASGAVQSEIAEALGVSVSTVSRALAS